LGDGNDRQPADLAGLDRGLAGLIERHGLPPRRGCADVRLELPFDVEQAEGVNFRHAWPPDAYRANQPKLIVVKHRCFAAVATDLALDERHIGIGIETADMLVKEILSRNLRDRRAVARYGGLTGSPDESGKKRREKGLARTGNARVRKGMIQLA